MASKKVSTLNALTSAGDDDLLYIADTSDSGASYASKRITVQNFLNGTASADGLAQEISDRTSGDTALSNRLDALEVDPTTATDVAAAIAVETAARQAADALALPLAGGTLTGDLELGSGGGGAATATLNIHSIVDFGPNYENITVSMTRSGAPGTFFAGDDSDATGSWGTFMATIDGVAINEYTMTDGNAFTPGKRWFALGHGASNTSTITINSTESFTSYTKAGYAYNTPVVHGGGGSGGATTIGTDGTATFGGAVSASTVPTDDTHLVNKLYADNLVAGVDLSGIATNTAAIAAETTARTNADNALSGRLDTLEADPTTQSLLDAETAARLAADALKLDLAGGTVTGNITASAVPSDNAHLVNKLYADNLVAGVDLSGIATNAEAIQALTNGAPELLNTITELADALGDDENFATTVTNQISAEATTRGNADTALSGRLDTLEADPTTGTALSTEASTRASADTALSGRLDTLEADPTTATALATETAARIAGDALLLPLAGGTMSGNILFGGAGGSTELLNLDFSDASQASNFTSNNGSTHTVSNGYAELTKAPGSWQLSGIVFDTVIGQDYTIVADFEPVGSSWRRAYVEPISNWSGNGSNPNSGTHSSRYEWTVTFTATETQHVFWVGGGGNVARLYDFLLTTEGAATTAAINVDGSATFSGLISADTVPTADAHLVNKLYADSLVAGVDLSGIATNAAAISGEATTRANADTALSNRLDTLEADPTTQTLLTAEETARIAGDALLLPLAGGTVTGNITASAVPSDNAHLVNKLYADNLVAGVDLSGIATNAAAIEALTNGAPDLLNTLNELADAIGDDENFATTVTTQISNETTARTNADTALSGRLDSLEADPTTQTLLNEETAARQNADTVETNARTSADTALSGRLDTLEADPTTGAALTAETNARTSADTALSGRLDTLEADPTTATALSSEASTRASADTALSNRLDTLEADPTTQTLLTAEETARIAADALLLPLAGGTMSGDIIFGGSGSTTLLDLNFEDDSHGDDWVSFSNSTHEVQNGSSYSYLKVRRMGGTGPSSYIVIDTEVGTEYTVTVNFSGGQGTQQFFADPGTTPSGSGGISSPVNPRNGNNGSFTETFTATDTNYVLYLKLQSLGNNAFIHDISVTSAGSTTAAAVNVDGTALFVGNVTASAVPTDNAHLVNKLYADQLVSGVDLSGIATNAAAIQALTNGAPELLNTLSEIGDAIGDDENFAATITGQIASETTARTNADTALSGRLNALEADPTTGAALTAETVARTNADNALSGRLNTLEADPTTATALAAETTARTNADTALSGRLDTLETDATTQTLLDAEATARANADTLLDGRLDTLEADPTTGTALAAEATTRASADTAMSGRLDTLEADPTTATAVTNAIAVETAARQAADALLLPLAGGTMSGAVNFGQGAAATPTISLANSSSGSENVNGLEAAYPSSGGNGWQTYTADVSKERASGGVHYFEVLLGGGGWSSTRGHFGITGTETNAEMGFGNSGIEPFYTVSENKSSTIYNRPNYNSPDFDNGDVLGIRLDIDNDRIYYTVNGVAEDDEVINTTATHYRPAVDFHNSGITFRFAAEDMEYMPAGASAWASGGGAATVVGVDGTATFGGNVTASAVPSADAHLVNKLYADNLVAGVDLSGIATNSAAIQALTNGAPELLNTLQELAGALGDDANFSTTVTGQIAANEVHIDNVATLSGVAKDSTSLGAFTGSTISDTSNIKVALQALETAIETPSAASQIQTVEQTANGTFHVTFVDSNNGSATAESLFTDGGLTYNPFTDLLSGGSVDMTKFFFDGTEVTATGAELNFLGGLTSGVQTQLNGKVTTGANISALVGDTTAGDVPVDVNGTDNYLFLVIDKANGALTAIDKTFLEAE